MIHLNNNSWEILIHKSHESTLHDVVSKMMPGACHDQSYDPMQPTTAALVLWDSETARELCLVWFRRRAIHVIRNGLCPAATYYAYRLNYPASVNYSCIDSSEDLVPTFHGYLQSKADALKLVKACLLGHLRYSCCGPEETTQFTSGDIIVWTTVTTDIDYWYDGNQCTQEPEKDFGVQTGRCIGIYKKIVQY